MKKIFKRMLQLLLVGVCILSQILPVSAKILEYNGSGSGGSAGTGGNLANPSYSVPYLDTNRLFHGYRFAVFNEDGSKKDIRALNPSYTVDVFTSRPQYSSRNYDGIIVPADSNGYIVSTKQLSKKEWINSYSGYSVALVGYNRQSSDGVQRYSVDNSSLANSLPTSVDSAGLKNWFSNSKNQEAIYTLCGLDFYKASAKDYIVVEPLYSIALAGIGVTGTPSDFAMIGINDDSNNSIRGGWNKTGAEGAYQSGTIQDIAEFISYRFPDSLWTETDYQNQNWRPMNWRTDGIAHGGAVKTQKWAVGAVKQMRVVYQLIMCYHLQEGAN